MHHSIMQQCISCTAVIIDVTADLLELMHSSLIFPRHRRQSSRPKPPTCYLRRLTWAGICMARSESVRPCYVFVARRRRESRSARMCAAAALPDAYAPCTHCPHMPHQSTVTSWVFELFSPTNTGKNTSHLQAHQQLSARTLPTNVHIIHLLPILISSYSKGCLLVEPKHPCPF